ncbi:MAG: nicotinate-nucleotide adenylyltransferase [Terrimonas sp.]|nr:nicotinate-nucleotide adenylyltransferase [Terrimonas sp.]
MKVGLYFGSFNPVHVGHLIIANHVLNETGIEKLWFIVSPQNPLKNSQSLINEYDRLHLVKKAIGDDPRMKASDIEFYLPRPSYTIDTLAYLKEKYPGYEFLVIMGSDSFQNIKKWKNHEILLKEHHICIYKRPGFDIQTGNRENIIVLDAPLLEISATRIREMVQQHKSIRYLVPDAVREEIEAGGYYKNKSENKTQ